LILDIENEANQRIELVLCERNLNISIDNALNDCQICAKNLLCLYRANAMLERLLPVIGRI